MSSHHGPHLASTVEIDRTPMFHNLPFLLKLCDDNSPRVRTKVLAQLREIPDLAREIQQLGCELSASQREALAPLIENDIDNRSDIDFADEAVRLINAGESAQDFPNVFSARTYAESDERPHWLEWLDFEDEWAQLEAALDGVARWLDFDSSGVNAADAAQLATLWPDASPPSISEILDDLARDFRATHEEFDAADLADWLFARRSRSNLPATTENDTESSATAARVGPELRGAPSGDFYNPLNSHLVHVVRRGRGLPIALAAIFMLVGRRVGLDIHGCNFPGHFLAFAEEKGAAVFYDPFDGGRELTTLETSAICRAAPDATARPARARDIIARFLRNLATAYEYSANRDKARFMLQLLAELEATES